MWYYTENLVIRDTPCAHVNFPSNAMRPALNTYEQETDNLPPYMSSAERMAANHKLGGQSSPISQRPHI
jgi:hypothetical protein